MSDENFLTRWSRRKRALEPEGAEVEAARVETVPQAGNDSGSGGEASTPALQAGEQAEEPFDVASLPPLDSITSASDVTAFLRKGVPTDITRAALRRAWTTDPAIRDFVGLAENAWDFNDPNAMEGFGPLDHTPEQVRQMVAELFGETRRGLEDIAETPAQLEAVPTPADDSGVLSPREQPEVSTDDVTVEPAAVSGTAPAALSGPVSAGDEVEADVATQQEESRDAAQRRRKFHGGALPQ